MSSEHVVAQRPCEAQEREEGSRGGIPLLLASEIVERADEPDPGRSRDTAFRAVGSEPEPTKRPGEAPPLADAEAEARAGVPYGAGSSDDAPSGSRHLIPHVGHHWWPGRSSYGTPLRVWGMICREPDSPPLPADVPLVS